MALLEEINRNGTTVVVCTHDRTLVNRMQKRVIEISDGSLVRDKERGQYVEEAEDPDFYVEPKKEKNEQERILSRFSRR